MSEMWPVVPLVNVVKQRKEFVRIDDMANYRRCRVQLHAQGIVLRDIVSGAEIKVKRQQICRAGDFLVAEIDAKVGGFGIVPDELDGAIVSSHYFLFEIDEKALDRRFLNLFIRLPAFHSQVTAQGSTNYAAIRPNDVLAYKIPLPNLSEQRRVVARINELATKLDDAQVPARKAMSETKIFFESVVEETFKETSSIEHRPLSALTFKIGSGSTPKGGRSTYPSSGIPFIRSLNVRMRNFQWDGIAFIDKSTHEAMSGTKVKPNDVLLNITGASIGRVACAPVDLKEANVNQHVSIIPPVDSLNPRYLMYWLSRESVQNFINNEQKGATRQGFTKAQIGSFDIPLRSLAEQCRIVSYLDRLQEKIDSIRQLQIKTLANLDDFISCVLREVFKGQPTTASQTNIHVSTPRQDMLTRFVG